MLSAVILMFITVLLSVCWFDDGVCPHHEAAGFRVLPAQIVRTPVPHGYENGHQTAAGFRQGVFHLGRDDGIHLPVNQTIGFQFPQLLGQHFWRRLGNGVLELAVAMSALQEMPEDDAFVFVTSTETLSVKITCLTKSKFVPVIVISGIDDNNLINKLRLIDIEAYLAKPVDDEVFINLIKATLIDY